MARLWLRMAEIFGHKWTSSYGDEPNESWSRCLGDITPDQIAQGLNALLNRQDEWPPTAVGFRNLCLNGGNPDAWERRCHEILDTPQLEDITAKERRCADGLEQLQKLREEVGL